MCTLFSVFLDIIALLAAVFFGWFGYLFLFQPRRYLRAFASVRLENFQRWGLSDEEISRRPPAVFMQWLTKQPYRRWLESLAQTPERHRLLGMLVRLYGIGLSLIGLLIASAWLVTIIMQFKTCL